jgi:hypothetical protein
LTLTAITSSVSYCPQRMNGNLLLDRVRPSVILTACSGRGWRAGRLASNDVAIQIGVTLDTLSNAFGEWVDAIKN